jgi:hypothetical protein
MQQPIFQFGSEPQNTTTPLASSSHCSSVQERLVNYGSEALNSIEHLGLIVGSQSKAEALLQHFGSLPLLARASVQELLPFLSRAKALRLKIVPCPVPGDSIQSGDGSRVGERFSRWLIRHRGG